MLRTNLFNRIKNTKSKYNQWRSRRYNQQHQQNRNEDVIEFNYPQEEKSGFSYAKPWIAFLSFSIVGGTYYYLSYKKRKELEKKLATTSIGKAKIGGTFSLVDHYGRPITSANLLGTYSLIYFGFTYCPDICPVELRKMKKVVEQLDESIGEVVQPVLITVDPWRDSVEQMATYVKEFHPRLLGLTGTPQQVEDVSKAFRVYSSKGPEDESEDYLVDHSIFMYLMDKDFQFLDFFGVEMEEDEIVERIRNHLVGFGDAKPPTLFEEIKKYIKSIFKKD